MSSPRTYLATLVALVLLLAATMAAASLPLGPLSLAVALAIAGVKVSLVALYFMHLRTSSPRMRVFAAAGLVWLAILFGLTFADYLTRRPVELPRPVGSHAAPVPDSRDPRPVRPEPGVV